MAAPLTARAAETAVEAAAVEHCGAADHDSGGADHTDGQHDHHAHGCGACHVHLLNVRASAPVGLVMVSSAYRLAAMEAPKQAAPGALFRPPRV